MKTEDQGQGRGRAVGRRRGREQKRAAESAPRGAASAGWCTPPTPSAAWRPRDPQLAGGGARPKVELVHHVGHVHPGVVKGVARGARSEVERARDLGEGWGIQGWSAFSSSGGFGGFGGARLRQLVGAALAPLLPALGAASPFFCAAPSSPGQSPPCCSRGLGGRPGGRRQHNAGAGGKGVGPWCRHRPEKQGSAEAAPPTLLAAQCGPRGGGGAGAPPPPLLPRPPKSPNPPRAGRAGGAAAPRRARGCPQTPPAPPWCGPPGRPRAGGPGPGGAIRFDGRLGGWGLGVFEGGGRSDSTRGGAQVKQRQRAGAPARLWTRPGPRSWPCPLQRGPGSQGGTRRAGAGADKEARKGRGAPDQSGPARRRQGGPKGGG